jgi:hypothetical protein
MTAPLTGAANAADVQASPMPATVIPTIKIVRIAVASFNTFVLIPLQRILLVRSTCPRRAVITTCTTASLIFDDNSGFSTYPSFICCSSACCFF